MPGFQTSSFQNWEKILFCRETTQFMNNYIMDRLLKMIILIIDGISAICQRKVSYHLNKKRNIPLNGWHVSWQGDNKQAPQVRRISSKDLGGTLIITLTLPGTLSPYC